MILPRAMHNDSQRKEQAAQCHRLRLYMHEHRSPPHTLTQLISNHKITAHISGSAGRTARTVAPAIGTALISSGC